MEPQRYRKKPVEIEAMQFDGTAKIIKWVKSHGGQISVTGYPHKSRITISTLEGDLHISPGDYVIRGVAGEFYPCKPDIFEATYDAIS